MRGVDKGIGSSLARRLLMLDARHMGWSEMRIVGLIKAPPFLHDLEDSLEAQNQRFFK